MGPAVYMSSMGQNFIRGDTTPATVPAELNSVVLRIAEFSFVDRNTERRDPFCNPEAKTSANTCFTAAGTFSNWRFVHQHTPSIYLSMESVCARPVPQLTIAGVYRGSSAG